MKSKKRNVATEDDSMLQLSRAILMNVVCRLTASRFYINCTSHRHNHSQENINERDTTIMRRTVHTQPVGTIARRQVSIEESQRSCAALLAHIGSYCRQSCQRDNVAEHFLSLFGRSFPHRGWQIDVIPELKLYSTAVHATVQQMCTYFKTEYKYDNKLI